MDEQSHEDIESQGRVGVVCCVGDEALGEFMQGNGNGGLQPYGEEGIGRDVVVMLSFHIAFVHLLAGKAILTGVLIRQGQGVARGHPAGADRCVAGISASVIVIVIVVVAVVVTVIMGSMKGVVGLEMPSSCAESRQRARIAGRATAHMFEAFLATRISISVTRSRFVTVGFGVLDKGHDPLLNLENGRSPAWGCGIASGSGPAAGQHQGTAGSLYHFISRRGLATQRRISITAL